MADPTISSRRTWLARTGASLLAVPLAMAGVHAQSAASTPVIKVVARRFTFTPAEIRLVRGQDTIIELTTEDVPMGFSVPDLHVRATILPGLATRVTLRPDKSGTFTFLCDVFCGSGHEDMSGTIIVT